MFTLGVPMMTSSDLDLCNAALVLLDGSRLTVPTGVGSGKHTAENFANRRGSREARHLEARRRFRPHEQQPLPTGVCPGSTWQTTTQTSAYDLPGKAGTTTSTRRTTTTDFLQVTWLVQP